MEWWEREKVKDLVRELNYPEHVPVDRPDKDRYFMQMAIDASKRSTDAETNHGCVIVNPEFRVLSTGYNGFPRSIDYSSLPNTRPHKYPWMLHAERNALAWCEKRPVDCIAYVTGESCNDCLLAMWQHGVVEVNQLDTHGSFKITDEDRKFRELFLLLSDMDIHKIQM